MSVDLSDYTDTLMREVTPLGVTSTTTSADLGPYMVDAFWEARLDGFMQGYVADEDGIVDPVNDTSVDLDRKYIALIVLYAGIRILRNRILNTQTSFRAKSGPVEFEQQNSATVLTEMLKQLRASKDNILAEFEGVNCPTSVMALDALSVRIFNPMSYFGSRELTG